jgi:DNA-binding Lrp family transcriptional regulator
MSPVQGWTFLTNHAVALLEIAREPNLRIRDIAERVGITERAAASIVRDLVSDGYLEAVRVGRRNVYTVVLDRPLRHPRFHARTVDLLIESLAAAAPE